MLNRREFLKGLLSLSALFLPKVKQEGILENELVSVCGRCSKPIDINNAETCWYCNDWLCYDCWDKYGHCGHPEAKARQEESLQRISLMKEYGDRYGYDSLGSIWIVERKLGFNGWEIPYTENEGITFSYDYVDVPTFCQAVCSQCLAVGCESRKCFSGIDHILQTGYQDVQTESRCEAIESVIGDDIVVDCQKQGTTSSELLRILKSTDGCVGEIKIHYDKCS